ncbi:hypothetical protein G7Y79_00022g051340 [Physcia stellaris]|nr:hypothetical protein G7Y79_00022g051340 [Physcia stellaris]
MRSGMLKVISVASLSINLVSALPGFHSRKLEARQDINFDLVDATPDPTISPGDTSNFNPSAAIASVVAAISANPLPQSKRGLEARDVVVSTYAGYTINTPIGNAAINAPLDCNQHDTYIGAKLFTSTAFDTALCAAACSAQSDYNLQHPPVNGPVQTCQFYNTYALYKNDVYQGQYCALYTQTWNVTYATNTGQYRGSDHYTIQHSYIASNATNPGQCTQTGTKTPLDLTATKFSTDNRTPWQTKADKNLVSISLNGEQFAGVSTSIYFPVIANEIYEISFEYFEQATASNNGHYFIEVGDTDGDEASLWWDQYPAGSRVEMQSYYTSTLHDGTGAAIETCWYDKVLPQTAPASGVWNSGRVVLKPRTNMGYFKWDFYAPGAPGTTRANGLQWRNVYVTRVPAAYCGAAK